MVERAADGDPQLRRGEWTGWPGPPWARRAARTPASNHADAVALARTGQLRASDTERAAVSDALTRHHLAGRLDIDEYSERLGVAYAAKTRGELAPLLADLPPEPPSSQPPRARPRDLWWVAFAAVAVLLLIMVVTGHRVVFGGWWVLAAIWIWWRTGSPARRRHAAGRQPAS
jgi:hypothetical protein